MKKTLSVIAAAVVLYALAFLFYRNPVLAMAFTPFSLAYPAIRKRRRAALDREELNLQFKDMLYSLSSSMAAGKTFESALNDVRKDLMVLYPNSEARILLEVDHMLRRLGLNESLETVLTDFAERTELEDIRNFADVLRISKRSGANLVEVVRNTASIISDKIEIMQEIEMVLTERRFEQKVLNVIPVAMILLLSLTAPAYMEPVFTTVAGRLVMTAAIGLLVLAGFISKKIMDIKV